MRKDIPFATTGRWFLNTLITLTFVAIFLFVAAGALKELPNFGYPIMNVAKTYLTQALPQTGAANVVSSVILDFRAYDTLAEATILFTAVIGVLAIVRRVGRKKPDEIVEGEDE